MQSIANFSRVMQSARASFSDCGGTVRGDARWCAIVVVALC
jgi:hypothetical protein